MTKKTKQAVKTQRGAAGVHLSRLNQLVRSGFEDPLLALCVEGVEAAESVICSAAASESDGILWLRVKPAAMRKLPGAFMPEFTGDIELHASGDIELHASGGVIFVHRSPGGACKIESRDLKSDAAHAAFNGGVDGVESLLAALVGCGLIDPRDARLKSALNEAFDALAGKLD